MLPYRKSGVLVQHSQNHLHMRECLVPGARVALEAPLTGRRQSRGDSSVMLVSLMPRLPLV
jgi:hypothetical protein